MPAHTRVGETVASYCPQCQGGLPHTIVDMKGAKIAQVTCITCGFTDKPHAAAPKARVARAHKGAGAPQAGVVLWEATIEAARGPARVYTRATTYDIGDIVCHEQFGPGVVLKLGSNKCTVLFKDQARLMASASQRPPAKPEA
jgi:Zn ribbon nucleic-acid-binding protein